VAARLWTGGHDGGPFHHGIESERSRTPHSRSLGSFRLPAMALLGHGPLALSGEAAEAGSV